jgi:predicted O-methyltransferase YrrM
LAHEGLLGDALRASAKAPSVLRADHQLSALRATEVPALLSELGAESLCVTADPEHRHGWRIGPIERRLLQTVAEQSGARTAFEIGTFDGTTTVALAQALPADGEVHTIDLPAEDFDATQHPDAFTGADVGRAFRDHDALTTASIVQLRGDSTTFDFSPWSGTIDLVLVDGAHDRVHGRADSRTALDLVAPGGWIFWDDADPYWHGLVDGILDVVPADRLTRIDRTSLLFARG